MPEWRSAVGPCLPSDGFESRWCGHRSWELRSDRFSVVELLKDVWAARPEQEELRANSDVQGVGAYHAQVAGAWLCAGLAGRGLVAVGAEAAECGSGRFFVWANLSMDLASPLRLVRREGAPTGVGVFRVWADGGRRERLASAAVVLAWYSADSDHPVLWGFERRLTD